MIMYIIFIKWKYIDLTKIILYKHITIIFFKSH